VRRLGDEVLDRGLEVVDHPPVEEVQPRTVEDEDGQPVFVLHPHRFSPAAIAAAY